MDEWDWPTVAQASSLRGTGWKARPHPRLMAATRVLTQSVR